MSDHNYFSNLIWQTADLLRGPYRPPQYERVMLPMTVLRRFDCVLAPTKERVLVAYKRASAIWQRSCRAAEAGQPISSMTRCCFEYYRLQKISEGSTSLRKGQASALDGPTEVGSGMAREEDVPLSQLIDIVNERFGTDFNQADQLFFDQIVEVAVTDDDLRQAAAVNPEDKFELVFKKLTERLFVERMGQNEEIFVRYMNDHSFRRIVNGWMAGEAYRRLQVGPDSDSERDRAVSSHLRVVEGLPEDRYVTCLPLVLLKAAAGAFSDPQYVEDDAFEWVSVETRHRLRPGMFVAQIVGKSMEPAIPDGSHCLFRAPVEGTRQGKIVLVQLRDASDPETGQRYTIKRYSSEKTSTGDSWRHEKITLKPANQEFDPIILIGTGAGELQVIAEMVEVL